MGTSTENPDDAVLTAIGEEMRDAAQASTTEQFHRLILETMREGTVATTDDGVVLYCNPSFERLVGVAAARIVGARVRTFFVEGGPGDLALLSASGSASGDLDLQSSQGPIPVAVSISTIASPGGVLRCFVVSDLRARRDVERLRQARAALETADRRKNEFIAMLGHELRNPLAPIRQAAEVLGSAHVREQDHVERARGVILRQTTHLTRLVDDLLDAGRISQGTLTIRRESTDLRRVLAAATETIEDGARSRGHQLVVDVPELPVVVDCDPVRMAQVVANLLSNAVKYTPSGGRIELSLRCVHGVARIEVIDDGRGIAPDLLGGIFEPFVQADMGLGRAVGGLGVGLTLVKRLVELHAGRVEVTSAGEGCGSRFVVEIPWHGQTAVETPDPPEPPPATDSRRILVVDDNEDAGDMLALMLESVGYRVVVAYDGHTALEQARDWGPDALVMDIGLPDMDGYEVARRLRRTPGGRRVVLIALTGYGQSSDRALARAAGFDRHLVKPVRRETLLEVLRECVSAAH